ncbi:unnamed protein product [Brugia pahangi]|uniref:Uncharacterized protein n=1 Tax=Brugia pahangi TaxID=6280 RepID=A0A0N4SZF5_BRUPA|nr:unnamed protein product [Brugia pahangi]
MATYVTFRSSRIYPPDYAKGFGSDIRSTLSSSHDCMSAGLNVKEMMTGKTDTSNIEEKLQLDGISSGRVRSMTTLRDTTLRLLDPTDQ